VFAAHRGPFEAWDILPLLDERVSLKFIMPEAQLLKRVNSLVPVIILNTEYFPQRQISTVFTIPEAKEFLPRRYHGDWPSGKHSNHNK